jgi:hypothetical protein
MRVTRVRYLPLFLLAGLLGGCDHNVVGPVEIPRDLVLMNDQAAASPTPTLPVSPDALGR